MKRGIDFIGVSAGAMIINDQGQVLLCKRSQSASNEKECWENPGGGVEFGETLEAAMRREIKEELGIEVDIIQQFPAANHILPQENQHWVATTFLVKIKSGYTPSIKEPHKCDAIEWFDINDLPSPLSIITQIDMTHFRKES